MPPAAMAFAPLVGGALAGGGAASAGKKGSDAAQQAANQQAQIQQQQLQFGKDIFNTGMTAFTPSVNYWRSLLKGGPAAMAAVGPSTDLVRGAGTSGQTMINAGMPMGGERNLALANNAIQTQNNMSRLYAGVQPTAASALGQLAALPVQAGTGIMGQAAPNVSAQLKYARAGNQLKSQSAQGLGSLLYNSQSKFGGGNSPAFGGLTPGAISGLAGGPWSASTQPVSLPNTL